MHGEAEETASKTLKPEERPLLDPSGMAVDPQTGEIAITGNEDIEPMEKVQNGEAEKKCRAAVQFVKTGTASMELARGARYVDKAAAMLFGEGGCSGKEPAERGRNQENEAAWPRLQSPTFAPDGSLLVYDGDVELYDKVGPKVKTGIIWQLTPKQLTQTEEEQAGPPVSIAPVELFGPGGGFIPGFTPPSLETSRLTR